ncbi:hypothetical protein EYF80_034566 [Liparis tanakae]|uniref:Uncharacterized protein n=1 Tax=Liparis tanakae TaxID=230148 RepID=A0A4Z2GR15_9TELE|nr:hypothetical protein EYF80_034566 [Liparis tanakae]
MGLLSSRCYGITPTFSPTPSLFAPLLGPPFTLLQLTLLFLLFAELSVSLALALHLFQTFSFLRSISFGFPIIRLWNGDRPTALMDCSLEVSE